MKTSLRLWPDRLASGFALDLRSLALFRFLIGLMVAGDALQRLGDLGAFHTDAGILPRALLTDASWRWSLHLANGEAWFQLLLLGSQLLAALMLALGWRTRVSAVLAWLLLVSAGNRNPWLLDAGDTLLMALLFWGLLLPLGARWSVDAALAAPSSGTEAGHEQKHLSWATIALVLQLLSSLFFNALLQAGNDAWTQGTALPQLLASAQLSLGLGPVLSNQVGLASLLGLWWWWLQLLGPLLLLLPLATGGRIARLQSGTRHAVLLQWALLQILILLTLASGRLPWVQLLGLSTLIGSSLWDRVAHRITSRQASGELRIFYDPDCRFCLYTVRLLKELLILPGARLLPALDDRRANTLMRANGSWVVFDRNDEAYLRGSALLLLFARSPLFGLVGRLALRMGLARRADSAYDLVARHRAGLSKLLAATLPSPQPSRAAGALVQRIAAILALLVLIWNLAGLSTAGLRLQAALAPPLEILRLDQHWNSFAASPSGDRWWVAPGLRSDGREIDVLRPDQTLSFSRPDDLASEPDGTRWRNWQERLSADARDGERHAWARYLCRQWNQGRSSTEPRFLQEFRLVEMFAATQKTGTPTRIEQRVRLRQDCSADSPQPVP